MTSYFGELPPVLPTHSYNWILFFSLLSLSYFGFYSQAYPGRKFCFVFLSICRAQTTTIPYDIFINLCTRLRTGLCKNPSQIQLLVWNWPATFPVWTYWGWEILLFSSLSEPLSFFCFLLHRCYIALVVFKYLVAFWSIRGYVLLIFLVDAEICRVLESFKNFFQLSHNYSQNK